MPEDRYHFTTRNKANHLLSLKLDREHSFNDLEQCECGFWKSPLEILACEICAGNCCGDCLVDCMECGRMICIDCQGTTDKTVCLDCDFKNHKNRLKDEDSIARNFISANDKVFIVVGGVEYPVSNKNGMAGLVAMYSEYGMRKALKYFDIKGLGVLTFKYRAIYPRAGSTHYHIYCENYIPTI